MMVDAWRSSKLGWKIHATSIKKGINKVMEDMRQDSLRKPQEGFFILLPNLDLRWAPIINLSDVQ